MARNRLVAPRNQLSVSLIVCSGALVVLATAPGALAQAPGTSPERQRPQLGGRAYLPETQQPPAQRPVPTDAEIGYQSEPPLDYYQRQWRWFSRHTSPQRFSRRDTRRRYGYNPPFGAGGPYAVPGGYGGYIPQSAPFGAQVPLGYTGLPYAYNGTGQAYIQGRCDERRFRDWKERHDRGKAAYLAAMDTGLAAFRENDYPNALTAFLRAATLNEGDPASRLHATYCLVAMGRHAEAASTFREALAMQSTLPLLGIRIQNDYADPSQFPLHLEALRNAVDANREDARLWLLLAYYFQSAEEPAKATFAADIACRLSPDDRVVADFRENIARLTPATRNNVLPHATQPTQQPGGESEPAEVQQNGPPVNASPAREPKNNANPDRPRQLRATPVKA